MNNIFKNLFLVLIFVLYSSLYANEKQATCTTFDSKKVQQDISKLLNKYPDVYKGASINFGLYSDPKNGIVFYVPNGWFPVASKSNNILFISQKEKSFVNTYMLKKIEKFWDEEDIKNPEEFIFYNAKALRDISIELATKAGDNEEYIGDITIFPFKSYTIAHYVSHRTGKIDTYKSSTLIWNGKELYTLVVTTKKSDFQLGEFLSSVWYTTFCDNTLSVIDPSKTPPSQCLNPDKKLDNKLLNELFSEYKDMEKVAIDNNLRFKRYLDKKEGFSIIAPNHWEVMPASKDTIFHIRHLEKNNIYQDMAVFKIVIGDDMLKSNTPKQIMKKLAKHMATPKADETLKVIKELKVIELEDRLVGRFRLKEKSDGIESFQIYTVVLKADKLYLIGAIVDKSNYDLGKLLSTIGIYTFVTRDICGE